MHTAGLVLLAFALSIDAFFAGAAYGLRRINVPAPSALLVGVVSGAGVFTALLAGRWLAGLLPASLGPWLGGLMLMAVGLWVLNQDAVAGTRARDPHWPDFDRSGHISPLEAVWLGGALALDALAAGVGVGLGGWEGSLLPAAVTGATMLSLMAGVLAGRRAVGIWRGGPAAYLPGTILILLGLVRILGIPS